MKKRAPVNYVNNKDLYQAIVDYHEELAITREKGLENPPIPKYVVESFLLIADKLATKPCYANYSFIEEMKLDGIEDCIKGFLVFNPERGNNPFAFFTQTIQNAFWRRIATEKKNRYVVYKSFTENLTGCYDSRLLVDSEGNSLLSAEVYDNISSFIKDFEEKEEKKKIKRKLKKQNHGLFSTKDEGNEQQ